MEKGEMDECKDYGRERRVKGCSSVGNRLGVQFRVRGTNDFVIG